MRTRNTRVRNRKDIGAVASARRRFVVRAAGGLLAFLNAYSEEGRGQVRQRSLAQQNVDKPIIDEHRNLREVISVRGFGAVGNGLTDDTVSVCNALNAGHASGRKVEFPAGTYRIVASNMPAGTNRWGATRGIGSVTLSLSGPVTWKIANGFSIENINFTTSYTYPNAVPAYFHTFSTGSAASSPRVVNCRLVGIRYSQTTVTDGSARGYGFVNLAGGVTNLYAANVSMEGIREGIVIHGDGHNGDAICLGATFDNIHGKNMQRVILPGSPSNSGGPFAGREIRINHFSLVNTPVQRDKYSGDGRSGHSPIIGDMGIGGSITNAHFENSIEHAIYVYGKALVLDNISGVNMCDIKIIGYTRALTSSASIRNVRYRMTAAPHTVTHAIITLYYVDGVILDHLEFKGTNRSGGLAGNLVRPWSVVSLSRSAKNITIRRITGQYLLQGVVNYETGASWEEAFDNISVEDCRVLDPHTTTAFNGYAALKRYGTDTPTSGWRRGEPLIKNVTVRNNYFGVTTETADTAETTTVVGRGRSGSKLVGIMNTADMSGVRCENNTIDGFTGDGPATSVCPPV